MPNENKTLEEVKEDISNVSGGFNWKFWERKSEEDSTTNLLSQNSENLLGQNSDSSSANPEDIPETDNKYPNGRRRNSQ